MPLREIAAAAQIQRHEYKFMVDERLAALLREAIRPFCDVDANAGPGATSYTIDSWYFDTPRLQLYLATRRGQANRFKLRVRSYPRSANEAVYFEVKHRYSDTIYKTRGRVPRELYLKLLSDWRAPVPAEIRGADRNAVEHFLSLVRTHGAQPVAMVRYEREAYFSRVDDYARVTFDRRICCRPRLALDPDSTVRSWRVLDTPVNMKSTSAMTLLELKFTSTAPWWMANVVRRFNLLRASFSKYGAAVQAWYGSASPRIPSERKVWP